MKFNIFPYTFLGFKIVGITFSSDLRKPCWITGKSLSPKSKKCPVLENNHIYIISNKMRSLHTHIKYLDFVKVKLVLLTKLESSASQKLHCTPQKLCSNIKTYNQLDIKELGVFTVRLKHKDKNANVDYL